VSITLASVRPRTYVDSVTLLQVTAELLGAPGLEDAALVMATQLNQAVLRDSGLLVGEAADAGPNDLVVAVRAADETAARSAIQQAELLLSRRRATPAGQAAISPPRSLRSAHRVDPDAHLAVISVPGAYAAAEARQALVDGLHVFLFSDNVGLEDEVELKRLARERDLLLMGPDCGTTLLGGVGFGFANVVRRGAIGIVGASGTGIQEVASLVHQAGHGISHAIGTGSRDLHAAVGGVTTLQAIELLRQDAGTRAIVLISKPSDPQVAERVLRALAATGKSAVAYLQGSQAQLPTGVQRASTLAEAAALATGQPPLLEAEARPIASSEQRHVRGLFCGGTLAQEARAVLGEAVPHLVIDFGDDQYTRGRAHPMIDPTLRNQAIVQAGDDPRVAAILLDVILGLGAHADPAGATLPAIRAALAAASADGREPAVVAHVVGTDQDPQGLTREESALRSAGVQVCGSNYAAARAAGLAVSDVVA
jgi:succinyl-CoA synthetase alpha subunit